MLELVALARSVVSHNGNLLLFSHLARRKSPMSSCVEAVPQRRGRDSRPHSKAGAAANAASHSRFLMRKVSLSLPSGNRSGFQEFETYERQGPHARRRTAAPTARPTRDPVDGHGRSMPPRVCTRNQPDAHHPCPALRAHSARHAVRRLERVRHAPSWVSGKWPLFLVLNEL